ncbi:hypothetical protein GQ600_349 [Phytophthora cactorum]|nr:hypothetical protein GQ600_349 [Phytophthora cactorum]
MLRNIDRRSSGGIRLEESESQCTTDCWTKLRNSRQAKLSGQLHFCIAGQCFHGRSSFLKAVGTKLDESNR